MAARRRRTREGFWSRRTFLGDFHIILTGRFILLNAVMAYLPQNLAVLDPLLRDAQLSPDALSRYQFRCRYLRALGLDESDDEDWEVESCASSETSDTTVVYHNTVWQNIDCNEDEQSDVETVVGDWEDPFITPAKINQDLFDDENQEEDPFLLPADLESGLSHLE